MNFVIWHLLAICSVMAVSFVAGMWYARNKAILKLLIIVLRNRNQHIHMLKVFMLGILEHLLLISQKIVLDMIVQK